MNLRIAVVCMFMLLVGCGDGSGNAANDQDASSDGDSDTDSDADGDADSDVDADADGDTDADGGGDAGGDGGVQPFRVLFIGNSYTASNSLADLFQQVVTSAGSFQVDVQAITGGGLWLEDHLNNSATVQTMTDGTWDYVVLQEQSYLALVQYQTFYDAIVSLTNSAQWAGGAVVYFQTWAREAGHSLYSGALSGMDPATMLAGLVSAYGTAAQDTGATVAPVGEAFAHSIAANPSINLYTSDGSHPSLAGSYLAACVFFSTIIGGDPSGIGYVPAGLSATDASSLRVSAGAVTGS